MLPCFVGFCVLLFVVLGLYCLRDTREDKHQLSASVWFDRISDNHGGLADNNPKYSLLMLSSKVHGSLFNLSLLSVLGA